jgi:hypothetical protein
MIIISDQILDTVIITTIMTVASEAAIIIIDDDPEFASTLSKVFCIKFVITIIFAKKQRNFILVSM